VPCGLCGTATEPDADANSWPACPACQAVLDAHPLDGQGAAVELLAALIDTDLDPADEAARSAARRLRYARDLPDLGTEVPGLRGPKGGPAAYKPRPGAGRPKRWEHVDRAALADHYAKAVATQRRAERPKRCTLGPCGLCGVTLALRWQEMALPWPDKGRWQKWAVCDGCEAAITRHASEWGPEAAGWLLHAALGLAGNPDMGANLRDDRTDPTLLVLAPYAATTGRSPTDSEGVAERFGYLNAADTEQLRSWAWRCWPRSAPLDWQRRRARVQAATARVSSVARSAPPPAVTFPGSVTPRQPVDNVS
jgi:hypothetical protein